jgi:hypothetical protein
LNELISNKDKHETNEVSNNLIKILAEHFFVMNENNILISKLLRSMYEYESYAEILCNSQEEVCETQKIIQLLRDVHFKLTEKKSNCYPGMGKKQIMEIFYSYTKRAIQSNQTFDSLATDLNQMKLSEFIRFIKDFQIVLPLPIIKQVFSKHSNYAKALSSEEFASSLPDIANEQHNYKMMRHQKAIAANYNVEQNRKMLAFLKNMNSEQVQSSFFQCTGISNGLTYKVNINTSGSNQNDNKQSATQVSHCAKLPSLKNNEELKIAISAIKKRRKEMNEIKLKEKEEKFRKNAIFIKELLVQQKVEKYKEDDRNDHSNHPTRNKATHLNISKKKHSKTQVDDYYGCLENDDDIYVLKKFNLYDTIIKPKIHT